MREKNTTIAHEENRHGQDVTMVKNTTDPQGIVESLKDIASASVPVYDVTVGDRSVYHGNSESNAQDAYDRATSKK